MPRSRRRHHSRSRSRSRSHSHDRDRDAKRRKIDSVESPGHKRSVSCEPENPKTSTEDVEIANENIEISSTLSENNEQQDIPNNENETKQPIKHIEEKLTITPTKTLSPKQLQKKLESEQKRKQKQLEREERDRKKQEEKERIRLEKEQLKKEKEELKAKERELKEEKKRKEREEKEAKRKEKEEREEAKRKEREQEKLKKQQEIEEKNREKQKIEEQKQKAAQVFANFFVAKKTEVKAEDENKTKLFMPFQVKSDMRLASQRRCSLTDEEKENLIKILNKSDGNDLYLSELKRGKEIGKCSKTWPYDDDVIVIEEDIGESICEDKQKLKKMRVKFLKFHENRRPAYYGTWRKKSLNINGRRPFVEDKTFFDYEVDSDDDWEEEEQGESLNGSDDEEKENEVEADEYEVDNEFFVPHGHLSDDEMDDEISSKLSPESHKEKLKLLKDAFDKDMQEKINKMKPRSIGCIWYNKNGTNVDEAIDRHLRPLAMITDGQIILQKRKRITNTPNKGNLKELPPDFLKAFLKHIDGNENKKSVVIEDFFNHMQKNDTVVDISKTQLMKHLKKFAQWKKCVNSSKFCWCVEDEFKRKFLS